MKLFKKMDVYVQAFLLVGGIIFSLAANGPQFFYPYYILGGWQLLSFTIHALVQKNWIRHMGRQQYGKTIFWLIIIGIFCLLLFCVGQTSLIFFYMVGLLFVSPFFGIWYLWICWLELSLMIRRELVHLK